FYLSGNIPSWEGMRELPPAQEGNTADSASLSGQTGYTSFSYCCTLFLYLYVGTVSIPVAGSI
ncbi:MAG: hypothetical protein PUF50_07945, partial [Erysipelotrichaceae bacterium]|nr:hypothetical protein [Erysipelotrichaceae bacterium]